MKKILVFLIAILFSFGCLSQKSGSGNQGIIGEVRWVEGNLMPSVGDTSYAERARGVPVEREIYIYEATKRDNAVSAGGVFYKSIKTELIKKVKSKKDGTFRANLKPGKYSIFVLEKDGFFANRFDGDNCINPVIVQANQFSEIKIKVNYKAYY